MGRIKKLELNICGGIDTPKPGFRDCQTKMKMFPFYLLSPRPRKHWFLQLAIKPIFSSDITGTQKLDS